MRPVRHTAKERHAQNVFHVLDGLDLVVHQLGKNSQAEPGAQPQGDRDDQDLGRIGPDGTAAGGHRFNNGEVLGLQFLGQEHVVEPTVELRVVRLIPRNDRRNPVELAAALARLQVLGLPLVLGLLNGIQVKTQSVMAVPQTLHGHLGRHLQIVLHLLDLLAKITAGRVIRRQVLPELAVLLLEPGKLNAKRRPDHLVLRKLNRFGLLQAFRQQIVDLYSQRRFAFLRDLVNRLDTATFPVELFHVADDAHGGILQEGILVFLQHQFRRQLAPARHQRAQVSALHAGAGFKTRDIIESSELDHLLLG